MAAIDTIRAKVQVLGRERHEQREGAALRATWHTIFSGVGRVPECAARARGRAGHKQHSEYGGAAGACTHLQR